MSRRTKTAIGKARAAPEPTPIQRTPSADLAAALRDASDLPLVLSLVFGGCCANVWSYEELLRTNPRLGSALTFSQMFFIALQALPSFLDWRPNSYLPRLKPSHVPLRRWGLQVILLTAGSLLNNWVFAFSIPLTVQIVFRSAGLAISMLLGGVRGKRYSRGQIASVIVVSIGVILSALSRPSASATAASTDVSRYTVGIIMLVGSLVLSGMLGIVQEETYAEHGPHWREGVFYTHTLSLPVFLFLIPDVKQGFAGLTASSSVSSVPYLILGANLATQAVCVSGVNRLNSRVSSVTTNLALTVRKALSLCLSVWWFGSGWNAPLAAGAGLVFLGSIFYALASSRTTTSTVSSTPTARTRAAAAADIDKDK